MYWRYLSKKHFIGIVECFSKFFILHRQRSLLYKLFWCFCPRKIALLRNWCQIRFLFSLYKSLNTIRNVFIDDDARWWKNYFWRYIFFKKVIFPNSWKACIWNTIFIDKISFFRKSFFCIPTAQHSCSLIMRLLIIGKFLKCLAPQT